MTTTQHVCGGIGVNGDRQGRDPGACGKCSRGYLEDVECRDDRG